MTLKARIFIGLVSTLGLLHLAYGFFGWQSSDPVRYFTYLVIAVLCSGLNMTRRSGAFTLSVCVLFVLLGIVEMQVSETLTLGCLAFLFHYFSSGRLRAQPWQTALSIVIMAVAIGISDLTYRLFVPSGSLGMLNIRLLVAAGSFFVANTFPLAVIDSLEKGTRIGATWREKHFWTFPYYLIGAAMAGVLTLSKTAIGWDTALSVLPVIYIIHRFYRLQQDRLTDEKRHAEQMAALHLRTIEGLALAIEAKDATVRGHLRRVQVYATAIGKELGLNEEELEALRAASLLHDIGKLAVPEHIISKPGRLTPEEFARMKVHPLVGAEILEQVQFPYPVAPIVRAHHEKWDGSGYPYGLKGEEIPLGARILAAVDCLDALASDRVYRRAVPLEQAMATVVSESGKSYDPRVVDVLQRRFLELEQSAKDSSLLPELSSNVNVMNGRAPAAGLEPSAEGKRLGDFLSPIAAARKEDQVLLELARDLAGAIHLEEMLPLLSVHLKSMISYSSLAVFLRSGNDLVAQYATGDNAHLLARLKVPVGLGMVGWVAEKGKPVVNGNPTVEPGFPRKLYAGPVNMQSALAVPLSGSCGVVGVLALYGGTGIFTKDHLRILLAVCPRVGVAIENALKYQRAADFATTDYLTGLPNARSLYELLESEIARSGRNGEQIGVLVCDLDGFKQVNDLYGHLEGNRVLQAVAAAMKDDCREYDRVARLGGDEFAMILPGFTVEHLAPKVQRLAEISAEACRQVTGADLISVSVGEAFYPKDGEDVNQLLEVADQRMYRMKHQHKEGRQTPAVALLPETPRSVAWGEK
jgi:diguanylate cyclase (GGDEF)-like protein/putative nucleotidyltransferase with HDIG domain